MKIIRSFAEILAFHDTDAPGDYLSALVLFNDSALADRALSFATRVESSGAGFFYTARTFDLMELRDGSNPMIESEAVSADLVFVGIDPHRPLPENWRTWCWKWAKARGESPGLLVLLLPELGTPDPALQHFFEDLALIAGMSLIIRPATETPAALPDLRPAATS